LSPSFLACDDACDSVASDRNWKNFFILCFDILYLLIIVTYSKRMIYQTEKTHKDKVLS
jgi:hypothetical protein